MNTQVSGEIGEKLMSKPSGKRNKNYEGKGHRTRAELPYDFKEFIAWDGEGIAVDEPIEYEISTGPESLTSAYNWEGSRNVFWEWERKPQPYVLLAHSKGDSISSEHGLSSHDCLEFMLDTKARYPNSIFIGFSFNYDINQILKDIPERLKNILYETNKLQVGSYWMEWLPRKHFIVKHRRTHRSFILYDVFGFFQTSFLQTCREYLGEDDPDLGIIERGKQDRVQFKWEELEDKIAPYNRMELTMLVRVMDQLRDDLHSVGIDPSRWHGPGAIANEVLAKYNIPISRDIPEEVLDASQYAYAGGRFEAFGLGRYANLVWEYDIHSAYPAAATQLPDLSNGAWEHVEAFESGTFGVWYVDYCSPDDENSASRRPGPLFCRAETGLISYPAEVQNWYWTPEAKLVCGYVKEGWIFRPNTERKPFSFITDLYDERRILQNQGSSAQRAIKLILNSLYGKTAQCVGGKGKPPRWHQLEYAGYITSYTRSMIYEAMKLNPDAIIAVETDAIFSTVPLDLDVGPGLGQWERKEYKEIVYLQSGFYYATKIDNTIVCKYRGMDRDRETMQPVGLPYRYVLDHLDRRTGPKHIRTPGLLSYTTRFIGLGLSLKTSAVWRSWEKKTKVISLDQTSWGNKRFHLSVLCDACQDEKTMYECLHTMLIGGYAGESYPRALPWREVKGKKGANISPEELRELQDEFMVLEGADRFS